MWFDVERQHHYQAYNEAEQRLIYEAQKLADERAGAQHFQDMGRARLEAEAQRRAAELAQITRAQEQAKQQPEGEALRQAQQEAGLTQAQREVAVQAMLQEQQRVSTEAQLVEQQRRLEEFEKRLKLEREQLEQLHGHQSTENAKLLLKKEELSARRREQERQDQGEAESIEQHEARIQAAVIDAYERGRRDSANYYQQEASRMPTPRRNDVDERDASQQTQPMGRARNSPYKDSKLSVRNFDETETYKGLGAGFPNGRNYLWKNLKFANQVVDITGPSSLSLLN